MADGGRLVNPALDQAPVVDFHIPPDEMQLLFARRAVIQVTINELQRLKSEAAKDFDRHAYEAQLYAGVAASWAIVLTVCDTARGLLSARFRSAEKAFATIDKALATHDDVREKLDKVFGTQSQPRLTKAHLVAQLGPAYDTPKKLIEEVKSGRDFLKKAGLKENLRTRALLDTVEAVAEDVMLVNSALDEGRHLRARSEAIGHVALSALRQRIARQLEQAQAIDRRLIYLFERNLVKMRTA
ncbi:MAG: hypothetical protein ACRCUX_06120 [Beijerinckiaceae bacterium]